MSLDIFDAYATDEGKETEGVWINIGGDTELKIARAENEKHLRRGLALLEEHQEQLDNLPEDEKNALDRRITRQLAAETILVDWKNLKYKGKKLPYSQENAEMLLQHSDFRKMVMKHAHNMQNYRIKADEADAKN